jgi:hypothetical protein
VANKRGSQAEGSDGVIRKGQRADPGDAVLKARIIKEMQRVCPKVLVSHAIF